MRPVRLEMKGFSSYAEHIEIDFTDVELAAFVGPTGSGKSSIIDAITFALYGSVARYDERAVAPVINQLATQARVRLDFDVDGQRYSAVRVVRRTKTGATTSEARLERGEEVIAGDAKAMNAEIERLIGLDVAKFNKTVVLPQGRFADFLHDKQSNRAELLRDLLGLGVYARVGQAARERAKELSSNADVLEQTLGNAPEATDERLAELRSELATLDGLLADVDTARPAAEALAEQSRAALAARSAAETQLSALEGVAVPEGIDVLAADLAEVERALAEARSVWEETREALESAEQATRGCRSVAECDRLLSLHDRHDDAVAALDDAQREADQREAELDAASVAAAAATARIEAARDLRDERRDERDAADAERKAAGERSPLQAALDALDELDELVPRIGDAEREVATATAQVGAAAEALANAEAARERARRLAPAADLALLLEPGEPCPVCLQDVHELPSGHVDVHAELAARDAACGEATELSQVAGEARRHAESTLASLVAQRDALLRRLPDGSDRDTLSERLARIDALAAQLARAEQHLASAEEELAAIEHDPSVTAALDAARRADTARASALAVLETRRAELAARIAELDGVTPRDELTGERQTAERLAVAFEAARRAEQAASAAVRDCDEQVEAIRHREQVARERFGATRDSVAALAPPPPPPRLADAWRELEAWAAGAAIELRREIGDLDAQRVAAEENLTALVDGFRRRAQANIDEPAGGLTELRTQLERVHARTSAQADHLAAELDRLAKIREQIGMRRAAADVAKLLADVLKANRFEKWLLAEALDDLVSRATVRLLELTGGHYSLVADDGAFRIVDHRNADEQRDARSLSGGETFLASLALALALADITMELSTQSSVALESIFLDEGFGSLDSDTLDVVAESIEELGASGRMVGIVTHIRELAERMPTRFEVSRGPAGASVTRVDG